MKTFRAHAVGSLGGSQLAEQNPVLPAGHIGMPFDDPTVFSIGDGETAWMDLPAFNPNASDDIK